MKAKSIFFIVFAAFLAILAACSNSKHDESATKHHDHDEHQHAASTASPAKAAESQFQVDTKFQDQLSAVFASYILIKDALVASDAAKAKVEAEATVAVLKNADMTLLTGAAHHDWMTYLSQIESSLKEIASSADLDAQRKSFSTLSDNLYESAKAFGLGETSAFYAYCPMAFNNKGAYWLSDQSQIRNPYFGDKMLSCGEVKETLK